MEPVAALALFCNVVDLSERAVKLVKKAKEAYDSSSGLTKENDALLGFTGEMQKIVSKLYDSQQELQGAYAGSPEIEDELQPIGIRCHTLCSKITNTLESCRSKKQRSARKSIKATFQSFLIKSELEALQKELESEQKLLQISIAVSTR
ncbi:hypothetical protein F5B20DRAFT_521555 [Whalleya microplaca]|nr:hypothetical protein F5B20DRAFT_521555 [Whalleya microplaca]